VPAGPTRQRFSLARFALKRRKRVARSRAVSSWPRDATSRLSAYRENDVSAVVGLCGHVVVLSPRLGHNFRRRFFQGPNYCQTSLGW